MLFARVQAMRGHVDSVNSVQWLGFTNTLASASSDKTLSLWDARSGLTCATFYGHTNSINAVAVSLDNATLASSDADGFLRVWDARMVAQRGAARVAPDGHALNDVRLDRSGAVAAVAADNGAAYTVWVGSEGGDHVPFERIAELGGHEDAVQAVAFDPAGDFMLTASSDCTFKLWR
jgi:sperm-associated antigen 16 protein